MKLKRLLFLVIIFAPFVLMNCQSDTSMTKDEARVLVGQQDLPYDICEENGWYGDNICDDDLCPNYDSDCSTLKCDNAGVCSDGYWCKLRGEELPLNGVVRNCMADGQCETAEDCEFQGQYGRIPSCESGYSCEEGRCVSDCNDTWTILVYMIADNNLESSGVDDLVEMMANGSTDKVNIVVQADRSNNEEYSDSEVGNLPDWTTAKRLYVKKDSIEEIADLGEINMADENVLKEFIQWGTSNYPANNYALVLWDHGAGWVGFGQDEQADSFMSLDNVSNGIKSGLQAANMKKFDMIGFDACLMSSVEVLYELSPIADYLVVSEEVEPGHGWDYAAITKYLSENPDSDAENLGLNIIDGYQKQAIAWRDDAEITLSLINTKYVNELVSSIHAFANSVMPYMGGYNNPDRELFLPVGVSRTYSQEYGSFGNPNKSYNLVDLSHFLVQFQQYNKNIDFTDAITNINSAISKVIVKSICGEMRQYSNGVSIYFPYTSKIYDHFYDDYEDLAFAKYGTENKNENGYEGWADFLNLYQFDFRTDTTPPQMSEVEYNDNTEQLDVTAQMTNNFEDVIYTNFVFGVQQDSGVRLLYSKPIKAENNNLDYLWDYQVPFLSDGQSTVYAPIIIDKVSMYDLINGNTSTTIANIVIELRAKTEDNSGEWMNGSIYLYYNTETNLIEISSILTNYPDGGTSDFIFSSYQTDPTQYEVKIYYPVVKSNNTIEYEADQNNILILNNLSLSFGKSLPSEEETYMFGFTAEDMSGNVGSSFSASL